MGIGSPHFWAVTVVGLEWSDNQDDKERFAIRNKKTVISVAKLKHDVTIIWDLWLHEIIPILPVLPFLFHGVRQSFYIRDMSVFFFLYHQRKRCIPTFLWHLKSNLRIAFLFRIDQNLKFKKHLLLMARAFFFSLNVTQTLLSSLNVSLEVMWPKVCPTFCAEHVGRNRTRHRPQQCQEPFILYLQVKKENYYGLKIQLSCINRYVLKIFTSYKKSFIHRAPCYPLSR